MKCAPQWGSLFLCFLCLLWLVLLLLREERDLDEVLRVEV